MSELVAEYTASNGNSNISFKLEADTFAKDMATLSLTVAGPTQLTATYEVNLTTQSFTVVCPSLSTASALTVCLLACGIGAVTQDVIKCLNPANPPLAKNFIACMKGKGVSILASAAACAVSCLAGAATTTTTIP